MIHHILFTPIRDFPWWGISLFFVAPLAVVASAVGPSYWRARQHQFDTSSVTDPVTGRPYGPGPLWAGTEPMDYPDPTCVCGALWLDNGCSRRVSRLSVYIEPRDLWIGAYVSPAAVYVCPLPTVVIRWRRR